jgi:RNA polymerase sigma-70 factor (ECF subfamily)
VSDPLAQIPPELIEGARRGDDEALEELVAAVYPSIRRWALVQTGEDAEADDLTQDVLIRMVRTISTFAGNSALGTWLYAMTRNAAIDRHRHRRRARGLLEQATAAGSAAPSRPEDPHRRVERRDLRRTLELFCAELPSRQRQVFDLVELQGLSSAEAASLLGIEPVSVRANLFKARRRLRALFLESAPGVLEESAR